MERRILGELLLIQKHRRFIVAALIAGFAAADVYYLNIVVQKKGTPFALTGISRQCPDAVMPDCGGFNHRPALFAFVVFLGAILWCCRSGDGCIAGKVDTRGLELFVCAFSSMLIRWPKYLRVA